MLMIVVHLLKNCQNKKEVRMMRTENIKKPLHIPLYMMYPKFLFDLRISDTAKLLYVILLDRARMSAASERWTDPDGSVFVCYTVAALSETLHKGKTAIEDGLRSLEQACLIRRKRQGPGMASHIYVKLPAVNPGEAINSCGTMPGETAMPRKTATGNPTIGVPERQAKEGRDPEGLMTGKAATNKNNKNKNDLLKTMSEKRTACGRYKNVFLSDKELQTLQEEVNGYQKYIERLSGYMASTGKSYQDHAATITLWADQDGAVRKQKDYSYEEGESL